MGGMNSGPALNSTRSLAWDELPRLNINHVNRIGLPALQQTSRYLVTNCNPAVCVTIKRKAINLISVALTDTTPQNVYLSFSDCTYGNQRPWFKCPKCATRVAQLSLIPEKIKCRHCWKLPYYSQQISRLYRLIEKKHALGEKIFACYQNNDRKKKKGMHEVKFRRLSRQFQEIDALVGPEIYSTFSRHFT